MKEKGRKEEREGGREGNKGDETKAKQKDILKVI